MKTNLFAVAVAVMGLCSSAALADEWDHDGWDRDGRSGDWGADRGCEHQAQPVQNADYAGAQQRDGYQLTTTQVWVPGRYEQVRQAPVCHLAGWGQFQSQVCVGGGVVSQWVPGHYEAQQNWVWVGFERRQPVYGRHVSHGYYYRGHHRR